MLHDVTLDLIQSSIQYDFSLLFCMSQKWEHKIVNSWMRHIRNSYSYSISYFNIKEPEFTSNISDLIFLF